MLVNGILGSESQDKKEESEIIVGRTSSCSRVRLVRDASVDSKWLVVLYLLVESFLAVYR